MDKDRRVSIETISAQCGNCTHNYSRGTEDPEDLNEVCPKGAQRKKSGNLLKAPRILTVRPHYFYHGL